MYSTQCGGSVILTGEERDCLASIVSTQCSRCHHTITLETAKKIKGPRGCECNLADKCPHACSAGRNHEHLRSPGHDKEQGRKRRDWLRRGETLILCTCAPVNHIVVWSLFLHQTLILYASSILQGLWLHCKEVVELFQPAYLRPVWCHVTSLGWFQKSFFTFFGILFYCRIQCCLS